MCLAVPGEIITLLNSEPTARTGLVNFAGVKKEINLSFVPSAGPGDFVLVHAGFAIQQVDTETAKRSHALLREALQIDAISE